MSALAQPYGSPAVNTPHFAFPFVLENSGAVVVEQDSIDEVFDCVEAIVTCQTGQCEDLPGLGIPDLTFSQAPLNTSSLILAVLSQEPRANESVVTTALDSIGDQWQVAMTTSTDATSAQ